MKPIETDRLILRRFQAGDAADLFAYLHQPRAACFLSMRLADLDAAKAEAVKRAGSDDIIAVQSRADGRVIGEVFAHFEEPDTWSIGWSFNGDVAGRGYASEAAGALVDHLFADRGARRLYAYVEDDNLASQRLCERLGMRREGLFLDFISFENDDAGRPIYVNTWQYALLKRERQV
ncbi:Acetyltransferase family protein [Brevundimonas sp. SH203]|uniref:GNAT family N-acetyltransferase n=1 Tax=Brevundimonas sp. SH203 TaxID=345167 RepID=UPI0009CEA1A4|nr:GNAT family N-acetyltransferase [Brevundimonas sp. SH203]GAW42167.1 Acetyltransferase family protein [Brevundimonas sp. SH203]